MTGKFDLSDVCYLVEEHLYPVCILGGDRFCDWFSASASPLQLTTEYTYKMMRLSYEYGIRGFDISCRFNLIHAFKQLKEHYPEAIGIGNPNWLCGYKLKGTHLWEIRDRIFLTIIQKLKEKNETIKGILDTIPKSHSFRWFINEKKKDRVFPLEDDEIAQIYIDQEIWLDRINTLSGVTDFCVIGADYADWMCVFNRLDLLKWQIKTVREHRMIPVSVSHLASITIPLLEKEDVAAHWIFADKTWMYLNNETAEESIRTAVKPVTAFRFLSNLRIPYEIGPTIHWLKKTGVRSFLVGLENQQQISRILPEVIKGIYT